MRRQGNIEAKGAHTEELCIRFVNTVSWRFGAAYANRLPTPDALLRWWGENGLAGPHYLARIASRWSDDPVSAANTHQAALELREAIYHSLHALIAGGAPETPDLTVLNASLARSAPGVEIASDCDGLSWRVLSFDAAPLDLLRPIALSAANLMTGARAHKVRQCSDDRGCGWLFVDESRAQNRRWCAMGDCGNRAKAKRHRARKKLS